MRSSSRHIIGSDAIGIIKGGSSKPKADIPFKNGIPMTEKDRPRGKSYKEWNEKDDEANDSNNN